MRKAVVIGRYCLRRPHEADFAIFAHYPDEHRLFLDVGANAGQSALSFRVFQKRAPILSIEPNRYHEPDLRLVKRMIKGFDYRICGASDRNEEAILIVPVYKGVPLTGEASFDREGASDGFWLRNHGAAEGQVSFAEVPTTMQRLDDLDLDPAFVKIDVEGFELEVLKGLRKTIESHRPLLMVESSIQGSEVEAFLAEMGYSPHAYSAESDRLDPLVGKPPLNLFYLSESGVGRWS